MEEDLRKTSHISYKDYQKKVTKKPNEGMAIFVSAFFILLLLFLGIAKQISPDIDVSIGEENTPTDEKTVVDERLKLLQMEDNGDNMFSPELDEKVVIPEEKKAQEPVETEETVKLPDKEANPSPAETASPAPKAEPVVISKVVVGYYTTNDQAEVAKGIIAESGLNISPFVRSIGGAYTIQVGSYTSRDKAQSVANDLLRNNYPARIISE
jgi:cell division septation protein DedD